MFSNIAIPELVLMALICAVTFAPVVGLLIGVLVWSRRSRERALEQRRDAERDGFGGGQAG